MKTNSKRKRPLNGIKNLASTKKSKFNNEEEEGEEEEEDYDPLHEIKNLLSDVEPVGEYCVGGVALELPILPGLYAKNYGIISLPLIENQAEKLINICKQAPFGLNKKTLVDKNVRDSYELDASELEFKNPEWDKQLQLLVEKIGKDLGCVGKNVQAKLYKLLLYKTGGHFLKHKDTEKESNMFGTLIIQLPSIYEGGELIVYNRKSKTVFDFGIKNGKSQYLTHYAAHYADLEHEILTVTSGYRLVLTYNLCWTLMQISYPRNENRITRLNTSLKKFNLGNPNETIAILLEHEYTEKSFISCGIKALKGIDSARFNLLNESNNELPVERQFSFYLTEINLVSEVQLETNFGRRRNNYSDESDDYCGNRNIVEEYERSNDVKGLYNINGEKIIKGDKIDISFFDKIIDPSSEYDEVDLNDSQVYGKSRKVEKEGYMGNWGNTRTTTYFKCFLVLIPKSNEFETFLNLDINGSINCLENEAITCGIDTAFFEKFNKLTNLLTKKNVEISIGNFCNLLSILTIMKNLEVAKFYFTAVIKKEILTKITSSEIKMFASKLGGFAKFFGWDETKSFILNLILPVLKQENVLINCYLAKELKSLKCLKDTVSFLFEWNNELLKYQNLNGIFYELCDTLLEHESSEDSIEKLTKEIRKYDEKIANKMFSTSITGFMENFEKFKTSKCLMNLFQSRLKWLESQINVTPQKISYKLAPTFIGHPQVNEFLTSDSKEFIYDAFNDSRHASNFINKHRYDSQFIEMEVIGQGKNVKVKFVKRIVDRSFEIYQQNKREYDLIKQKLITLI